MALTISNTSKATITITNVAKATTGTFDEATHSFDDATYQFQQPEVVLTRPNKNNLSISNVSKN